MCVWHIRQFPPHSYNGVNHCAFCNTVLCNRICIDILCYETTHTVDCLDAQLCNKDNNNIIEIFINESAY